MQNGLISFENRDKKWAEILQNSLFIGMISAFVGYVFCDLGRLWLSDGGVFKDSAGVSYTSTSGLVPVLVMFSSAILMAGCGALMKVTGWKFLNDYALPISMVGGMLLAIPYTAWLG